MWPLRSGAGSAQQPRQQQPRPLPVGLKAGIAGEGLVLLAHIGQKHRQAKSGQYDIGLPVHRHHGEGEIDQHFAQIIGVAAAGEKAILDQPRLQLEHEMLLGIAGEMQEHTQQIDGDGSSQQRQGRLRT